ncbi:MAG: selenocysteine synthase, partial [bacterium]|nr:selenocysteine synthase [bacterium]
MNRRDILRYLSVTPVLGSVLSPLLTEKTYAGQLKPGRNLFQELGIRTFINAAGTYTHMSGTIMYDEVVETITASVGEFAMIDEVQDRVGERIAVMCHAEAATVTAGCWSAAVLGTAGVLTGSDPKKIAQLPDVTGMRSEIIVQKAHNFGYVHALKNTGAKVVEIETVEDFKRAVSENTAMTWFLNVYTDEGKIQHHEWLELCKQYKIPAMIDIAADVPPVENLWKYNDMGFDLVCISGGKLLRGPQSAGILMGKKNLIAAARLSAPPRGMNIGRGMKVNKEEILAMYVALEKYVNTDHEKEMKSWSAKTFLIENAVKKIPGVRTEVYIPPIANRTPVLLINWDDNLIRLKGPELMEKLRNGIPSIEVMPGRNGGISVITNSMQNGQEKIVAI